MSFEAGRRKGSVWDDANKLNTLLHDFPFHTTGKSEKDFEKGFSSHLMASKSNFKNEVITQIDKTKSVQSVYCFGKKHRPDLTINEDGLAVEIKFITYAGLKEAIGQGYFYRLRYKFVFLILVISEDKKDLYFNISEGKEKDLEDILESMSESLNIFTYFVPAFVIKKPGIKKCIAFFK